MQRQQDRPAGGAVAAEEEPPAGRVRVIIPPGEPRGGAGVERFGARPGVGGRGGEDRDGDRPQRRREPHAAAGRRGGAGRHGKARRTAGAGRATPNPAAGATGRSACRHAAPPGGFGGAYST